MNKWYQEIIVEHKELDNKMYHCFDDENFKKLTNERNEQLKEIERLNNIINEIRKWLEEDYKRTIDNEVCDYPRYYLDKFDEIVGSDKE